MPVSFVTPSTSWAISSPNSSRTCSIVTFGVLDDVVHERGGDRLVVEPQLGADLGGAERVVDELFAGAALLALVRLRGERERPCQKLPVNVRVVGRNLGEQFLDEILVLLWSLENRHTQIVLRAPEATVPV